MEDKILKAPLEWKSINIDKHANEENKMHANHLNCGSETNTKHFIHS